MADYWNQPTWQTLQEHATRQKTLHLKDLLQCDRRRNLLNTRYHGIHLDASRSRIERDTWPELVKFVEERKMWEKIDAMFSGQKINQTENRAVLHIALRAQPNETLLLDGVNVVPEVHAVLKRIREFSDAVRTGKFTGYTGKTLKDVVCIGIGGSHLGVEFVSEALRSQKDAGAAARGRRLRFLANVDPIDVERTLNSLDAEETLVLVVSKTFTTAETMLNARTVKDWILRAYDGDEKCVAKHFCAVSTNLEATAKFGINSDNVFGFWDWVGGRYSVCSAVGVLPLSLHYGYDIMEQFLAGAHEIDTYFRTERTPCKNIPVMMGMISFWNSCIMQWNNVAVLPYSQALVRFPAHIQQLTMESNGKSVTLDGAALPSTISGEIYFGEPGTNGQHSFYQLIHQGRVVPCEFIGFTKSQNPVMLAGEPVSNHDELMSNFFAQPDALALGKGVEALKNEGVHDSLVPHKKFEGNRPSMQLLIEGELDARRLGELLAIYEHRTAVEGFLMGVNSFDQWGVELGKVLAKDVRDILARSRQGSPAKVDHLCGSTKAMLDIYLHHN